MISVNDVSKRLGGAAVVRSVSFEAPRGAVTYLLGPNGAGKSTVMRMVAGLLRPDSGEITLDGAPTALHEPHQLGVGLGPFARNPSHTARAHLRWQARLCGLPDEAVDAALDRVGLSPVASKRVGGFSLGMAQRLSIASALLGNPPTILLDEPATGLDVDGTLWLRSLLLELTSAGTTLLIASHDLTEVTVTASRIVILGRGRVLADGDRDEIVGLGSGPRPLESAYLDLTRESVDYVGAHVPR